MTTTIPTTNTTTFIITDPCYLINSNKWSQIYKASHDSKGNYDDNVFLDLVRAELEIITQHTAWVANTGYGDWNNTLYGQFLTADNEFCADSGMVCVCKLVDDITNECLKHVKDVNDVATVFEAVEELEVRVDTSDECWTYLELSDGDGNEWHTIPAAEAFDEVDMSDYEDDEDEGE